MLLDVDILWCTKNVKTDFSNICGIKYQNKAKAAATHTKAYTKQIRQKGGTQKQPKNMMEFWLST